MSRQIKSTQRCPREDVLCPLKTILRPSCAPSLLESSDGFLRQGERNPTPRCGLRGPPWSGLACSPVSLPTHHSSGSQHASHNGLCSSSPTPADRLLAFGSQLNDVFLFEGRECILGRLNIDRLLPCHFFQETLSPQTGPALWSVPGAIPPLSGV